MTEHDEHDGHVCGPLMRPDDAAAAGASMLLEVLEGRPHCTNGLINKYLVLVAAMRSAEALLLENKVSEEDLEVFDAGVSALVYRQAYEGSKDPLMLLRQS